MESVYITSLSAWCNIKYGNEQEYWGSGGAWGYEDRNSNPLIYAHNLYLNNELVTNLIIPDDVTAINPYAFRGASCISSIVIPGNVKSIGRMAFYQTSIHSIRIDENNLETVGDLSFGGVLNKKDERIDVYFTNLERYIQSGFGQGLGVPNYYNYPAGLINLYLNNEKITNLIVPESITSLGDGMFMHVDINSVILPSNFEKSDSRAFYQSSLKTIYSRSHFVPELTPTPHGFGASVQYNDLYDPACPNLSKIYVPQGRGDTYKNKWTWHANIIEEVPGKMLYNGMQTAESIKENKEAHNAIYGTDVTFVDLSAATLGDDVTEETLKAGDADNNVLYFLPSGSNISGENIVIDGVAENVRLRDGSDIFIPEDITVTGTLTYERSIVASAKNAYTLCLPYDLNALPEGMRVYAMKEIDGDGNLVFTEVESIEANMPYLITTSTTISNLNTQNVTLETTPDEMEDAGTEAYEFRGTLSKISNEDAAYMEAYILQANKEWHPVSTDHPSAYIAAGRAFIVPTGAASRNVVGCVLADATTGIKVIGKDGEKNFYDLQGRRIEKPTKGLYITNGKITIIN